MSMLLPIYDIKASIILLVHSSFCSHLVVVHVGTCYSVFIFTSFFYQNGYHKTARELCRVSTLRKSRLVYLAATLLARRRVLTVLDHAV